MHLMTAGHADTPEIRERENRLRSLMMQCWMKSGRRRAWEALTSAGLEGFDYVYEKEFSVPQEYEDFRVVFEFEGVYRNAEVYLNGKRAGFRPYGYTNFYVEANEFLHFGMKNQIQVIARNADQPNSRWYSGAGIYRPVSLYMLPKKHIGINGVKISTVSIHPAVIDVKVETSASGELELEIFRGNLWYPVRSRSQA